MATFAEGAQHRERLIKYARLLEDIDAGRQPDPETLSEYRAFMSGGEATHIDILVILALADRAGLTHASEIILGCAPELKEYVAVLALILGHPDIFAEIRARYPPPPIPAENQRITVKKEAATNAITFAAAKPAEIHSAGWLFTGIPKTFEDANGWAIPEPQEWSGIISAQTYKTIPVVIKALSVCNPKWSYQRV